MGLHPGYVPNTFGKPICSSSETTNPNLSKRLHFEDDHCVACMQMSGQRLIV